MTGPRPLRHAAPTRYTAADRARMAAAVLAGERARQRRAALDRLAGYGACALAIGLAVALFFAY